MTAELTELTFEDLLDRLASRTPVPGGGAVAAATGALAGALGRMVVAYSVGKKTEPALRERLDQIATQLLRADHLARALMTRDARAYETMTARRAAPDVEAYQQSVLEALAVPMELAAAVSAMLACLDGCKESLSRYLISDLGVVAVLGEAAAAAARYMVQVNASACDDEAIRTQVLGEIDEVVAHCGRYRAAIEAKVQAVLKPEA